MKQQRSPKEKTADAAQQERDQSEQAEQEALQAEYEDIISIVLDGKDLSGDLSRKVSKWAAKQGSGIDAFEAIRRLVELGLKAKGK